MWKLVVQFLIEEGIETSVKIEKELNKKNCELRINKRQNQTRQRKLEQRLLIHQHN